MSRRIQEAVAMVTVVANNLKQDNAEISKILNCIKNRMWSDRAMIFAKFKFEVSPYFYDTLKDISSKTESERILLIKYISESQLEKDALIYLTFNFQNVDKFIKDKLTQ